MKRYFVFAGSDYYPNGGWSDFKSDFDTFKEAKAFLLTIGFDWFEIVDTQTKMVYNRNGWKPWESSELSSGS